MHKYRDHCFCQTCLAIKARKEQVDKLINQGDQVFLYPRPYRIVESGKLLSPEEQQRNINMNTTTFTIKGKTA